MDSWTKIKSSHLSLSIYLLVSKTSPPSPTVILGDLLVCVLLLGTGHYPSKTQPAKQQVRWDTSNAPSPTAGVAFALTHPACHGRRTLRCSVPPWAPGLCRSPEGQSGGFSTHTCRSLPQAPPPPSSSQQASHLGCWRSSFCHLLLRGVSSLLILLVH